MIKHVLPSFSVGGASESYDKGYEETFGERDKGHKGKRYVYTSGGEPLPEPIEVSQDWTGAERRAQTATEEIVYGNIGAVATGVNISTRKQMRDYMKREGVAHASDYSPAHYEKKQAERAKAFTPGSGYDKERRQQAMHVAIQKLRGQGKLR